MAPGRNSFVIRNLLPDTAYRVRVYAVNDGQDSAPAQLSFTLPRLTTSANSFATVFYVLLTCPEMTIRYCLVSII